MEFLEIKLWKVLQLHEDCDFRDSSVPCQPILSLYQIMKLPLRLSFQLMSLEASAAGKQILAVTLWIFLSVDMEVVVCHPASFLWWLQEKLLNFSLLSLFLIVRMGVAAYMPFTCFA